MVDRYNSLCYNIIKVTKDNRCPCGRGKSRLAQSEMIVVITL